MGVDDNLENGNSYLLKFFIIFLIILAGLIYIQAEQIKSHHQVLMEKDLEIITHLKENECRVVEKIPANGLGAKPMVRFECADRTFHSISQKNYEDLYLKQA